MTANDYKRNKTHYRQKKIVEEIMEEAKLSGLNSPAPVGSASGIVLFVNKISVCLCLLTSITERICTPIRHTCIYLGFICTNIRCLIAFDTQISGKFLRILNLRVIPPVELVPASTGATL